MEKPRIAAFDFDGTLTRKDTLPEFIRFARGRRALWAGLLLHSPMLVAMKLHLYPNGRAKERVFAHFFRGMSYAEFRELGRAFAERVELLQRPETVQALLQLRDEGAKVYIVSASIDEWVRPWCERLGVTDVLATRVAVGPDGTLMGTFSTPNCYGREKVRRLLAVEPDRPAYHLTAFGDSAGDEALFREADEAHRVG